MSLGVPSGFSKAIYSGNSHGVMWEYRLVRRRRAVRSRVGVATALLPAAPMEESIAELAPAPKGSAKEETFCKSPPKICVADNEIHVGIAEGR